MRSPEGTLLHHRSGRQSASATASSTSQSKRLRALVATIGVCHGGLPRAEPDLPRRDLGWLKPGGDQAGSGDRTSAATGGR